MCAGTALWEDTVGLFVRAWEEADDIGGCSSKTLQGTGEIRVVVIVPGPCLITGGKSSPQMDLAVLRGRASYQVVVRTSYKENNICWGEAAFQLNFCVRAALAC